MRTILRIVVGLSEFGLVVGLIAGGIWAVVCKPFGFDPPTAGALAGALFGGAAVLLGNWINRANERHKKADELADRQTKLKAMIAAELINVTAGLFSAKQLFDAGVAQRMSGGAGLGQLDMNDYLPRPMPFTDGLGVELLTLDAAAVDALTTLRSNLSVTRQTMLAAAQGVSATNGLSLNTAVSLSNGLGHDMTIMAQVFEHIAPTRRLAINGDAEVLVSDALNKAAQPYAGPPQPPQ